MSEPGTQDARRVYFVSLGCPKNRVDSEIMLGELNRRDYQVVQSAEEADVLVVNTCGFVEDARAESIETIVELSGAKEAAGGDKQLVVAGCLTQRYSDELQKELPEVDLFLGTGEPARIGELLDQQMPAMKGPRKPLSLVGKPGYNYDAYSPRVMTTEPWTAYVKIAEGCSQRCAFCIIPRLRGGQKSRPMDDVVTEVRALAESGVREINLIAQDLTHYGHDLKNGTELEDLLRRLVKIDGIHWIRLLYAYPHNFTDGLIDVIASEDRIASYVDMPLQHIADPMLSRMRRRFSEADTRALVKRMRDRIPNLVFRTTFIVGHPGETQDEFQRLYDFVAESRFERMGVFKYSPEDGTRAARMPDHPMRIAKEDRHHKLMMLQQGISQEIQAALVGTEVDLLVEGVSKETDLLLQGRTWGQAPEIDGLTYVNEGWAEPGAIVRAEIVDSGDYDLVARILS
ncbi:MAG: 30S ribosomal protein S12 methylthiotransferase RimO [Myxococcota bacterium]|nr:30S ribosomal protein S12 methylthiotransferase RimO [Myxococcota bacterium]